MADTTKLGLINLLDTATLKNGTGGGAPALDETSPYTMSNLIVADRYTIWKTANPPGGSPINVDFDLGSNKTVTAVGILGYRPAGTLAATSLKVYSAASAAGYVPAGWTLQATMNGISGNPRDLGAVIPSVSQRYWRFEFTHIGTAWSGGRFYIGNPTDLGAIGDPGSSYTPFRNRLETPMPGGAVVLTDLGDPGATWVIPWSVIESSLRTTLLSLQALSSSFVLIDADENFFEVYLKGGRLPTSWRTASVYDASMELERLP